VVRVVLRRAVEELVRELLETLVAEICAADHEQGHHGPRREGADGERRRHKDGLVRQRTLGDGPHNRQLAIGPQASHLLCVEREVVAQHARGLLCGDLGEHRHVVEQRGDVVEQGEQARCHGGYCTRRSAAFAT
jgi:hypothetical protein